VRRRRACPPRGSPRLQAVHCSRIRRLATARSTCRRQHPAAEFLAPSSPRAVGLADAVDTTAPLHDRRCRSTPSRAARTCVRRSISGDRSHRARSPKPERRSASLGGSQGVSLATSCSRSRTWPKDPEPPGCWLAWRRVATMPAPVAFQIGRSRQKKQQEEGHPRGGSNPQRAAWY
jgi:hypothetical protein